MSRKPMLMSDSSMPALPPMKLPSAPSSPLLRESASSGSSRSFHCGLHSRIGRAPAVLLAASICLSCSVDGCTNAMPSSSGFELCASQTLSPSTPDWSSRCSLSAGGTPATSVDMVASSSRVRGEAAAYNCMMPPSQDSSGGTRSSISPRGRNILKMWRLIPSALARLTHATACCSISRLFDGGRTEGASVVSVAVATALTAGTRQRATAGGCVAW
mmetsp:Transcript_15123/g.34604  ORF Transcript_15123/g.34604 Transcript_15123/m.34604 type:complete len:216 (+) Transcript_15123:333-980(+)